MRHWLIESSCAQENPEMIPWSEYLLGISSMQHVVSRGAGHTKMKSSPCLRGTHLGGEDIADCPLGSQSQTYWIWTIAVVSKFFGTRDQFHGRNFFHGLEVELGNGFRMIQVLYAG